MLALTRKINGSIILDDNIVITILSIQSKKVRIGIKAPNDVVILREEIYKPQEKPQDSKEITKEESPC
jgi:carbon storage regulator